MITAKQALSLLVLAGVTTALWPAPDRPRAGGASRPATPVVTIGFIGDSLSALPWAGRQTVPALVVAALGPRYRALNLAQSGTTTADWLPRARTSYLPAALVAFRAQHVRLVHVMLGTNDSRDDYDVSPATYAHHLHLILAALRRAGLVVMLSAPPYASPGSIGGVVSATSDTRLRAYGQIVAGAVDGRHVLAGDALGYAVFAAQRGLLRDGVHPTARGAHVLARLWVRALARGLA